MSSQADFIPPKNIKIKPPLLQIQPLRYREEGAESALAKLNDLVNYIHSKINSCNHQKIRGEVQTELSELLLLPSRIGKCILAFESDYSSLWSRLLGILPGTTRRDKIAEISLLIPSIKIAVDSLFQESPNITLSKKIRRNIDKNLREHEIESPILLFLVNFVKDTLNSPSTPLKVSVGLLLSLPLYGAFMLIAGAIFLSTSSLISKDEAVSTPAALNTTTIIGEVRSPTSETISGESSSENQPSTSTPQSTIQPAPASPPSTPRVSTDVLEKPGVDVINLQENLVQVILVVSAGTLGSIVSILTRIREFRNENYRDSSLPIFVGLFKPIIGASFGVLMFALINSDLISISTLEGSQRKEERAFFFYSLAFVVGFSERLANDIVSRTENMFASSPSTPTIENVLIQQLNRKDLPPDVVQDLTAVLLQISTKQDGSSPNASNPSLPEPSSDLTSDLDADTSSKAP
jgi:hypothetical protein